VGRVLFEEHLTSIHLFEIERVSFAYELLVVDLPCQVYLMWGRLVLPSKTNTLHPSWPSSLKGGLKIRIIKSQTQHILSREKKYNMISF
jgi:hypothetical protein